MDKHWFLINTQKKLQCAVDDFNKSIILSIDTEYDSFRYFREILCLLQIKANDATYIFDPLNTIHTNSLANFQHKRNHRHR